MLGAGKEKGEVLTSGTEWSASGTGEVRLTCGTRVLGGRSARRGPKRSASGVGASWADWLGLVRAVSGPGGVGWASGTGLLDRERGIRPGLVSFISFLFSISISNSNQTKPI